MPTMPPTDPTNRALAWTVHPARRRPAAALGVLALTALAGWACADWGGAWGWGVFAAGLLTASLRRFYLPTTYRLDDAGVTAKNLARVDRLAWPEVRRFRYDDRGVFVSARALASLRDRYTGLHVAFDGNAEAVANFARGHVNDPAIVRRVNPTAPAVASPVAAGIGQQTEAV
jgi:hypothetical protein